MIYQLITWPDRKVVRLQPFIPGSSLTRSAQAATPQRSPACATFQMLQLKGCSLRLASLVRAALVWSYLDLFFTAYSLLTRPGSPLDLIEAGGIFISTIELGRDIYKILSEIPISSLSRKRKREGRRVEGRKAKRYQKEKQSDLTHLTRFSIAVPAQE